MEKLIPDVQFEAYQTFIIQVSLNAYNHTPVENRNNLACYGLLEEIGEFTETLDNDSAIEELGDALAYLALFSHYNGLTLDGLNNLIDDGKTEALDISVAGFKVAGHMKRVYRGDFKGESVMFLSLSIHLANVLEAIINACDDLDTNIWDVVAKNISKLQERMNQKMNQN